MDCGPRFQLMVVGGGSILLFWLRLSVVATWSAAVFATHYAKWLPSYSSIATRTKRV